MAILNNFSFSVKSLKRKVADMINNFKGLLYFSLRNGTIRVNNPINISVCTLLSCASSITIAEYLNSPASLKKYQSGLAITVLYI